MPFETPKAPEISQNSPLFERENHEEHSPPVLATCGMLSYPGRPFWDFLFRSSEYIYKRLCIANHRRRRRKCGLAPFSEERRLTRDSELIGKISNEPKDFTGRGMNRVFTFMIHIRQYDQTDFVLPVEFHVGAGAVDSSGMSVPTSNHAVP